MTVSTRTAINPPLLGFDRTNEFYADETDATCPSTLEGTLGMMVQCSDGITYQLVKATAAKTAKLAYIIDEDFLVGDGVATSNDEAAQLGIPHTTTTAPASLHADATHTYFWIQRAGEITNTTIGAIAAVDTEVYTSATAGKFDEDTGLAVLGARWTSSGTAGDQTLFAALPMVVASVAL